MEKVKTTKNKSATLALLFDAIPDQVLVVDNSCKLLFINRSFNINGTERFGTIFVVGEEICNDNKKSAIVNRSVWEKALSGHEFSMTEDFGDSVKTKKYFEIRFVPILDSKNTIIGAVGLIKDVSLLRRAEIDLIENRITLQETQTLAGISRWSFGINTEDADWDELFLNNFGISIDQKNKQSLLSVFNKEDKEKLLLQVEEAVRLKLPEIIFYSSFNHPKLGKRYLYTLGKIVDGTFVGVSHDITDIKLAEVALSNQNKELQNTKKAMLNVLEDAQLLEKKTQEKVYQLNAILSSMREGLVAVDSKMRIVMINQAAAALFRIAPDDAIGKPVDKICTFIQRGVKLSPKDSPLKRAISDNTIVGYSINDDFTLVDQSNMKIPVACTASALVGNLPVRGILLIRDITKEKEIDSAKNELISLASHQLRTPLSSVNWYSEMLLSGDAGVLNDDQKNYITEIHKGNHRMIDLVNALLNVSRIDMGTLSVLTEDVSLLEICNDTISDLASLVGEKKIKVETDITENISEYIGDKKMLSIIFQNLISNSVKYTPENGIVKIKVQMRNKGENISGHDLKQDSLILSVEDNGYGIPDKEKSKIFTKLYRANNVKEIESNGNGLGLYLVKSMIDGIGGSIWFISKQNAGTTFFVALPAKGMKKKIGTTIFT